MQSQSQMRLCAARWQRRMHDRERHTQDWIYHCRCASDDVLETYPFTDFRLWFEFENTNPECLTEKVAANIGDPAEIEGFDQLRKEDKERVVKRFMYGYLDPTSLPDAIKIDVSVKKEKAKRARVKKETGDVKESGTHIKAEPGVYVEGSVKIEAGKNSNGVKAELGSSVEDEIKAEVPTRRSCRKPHPRK